MTAPKPKISILFSLFLLLISSSLSASETTENRLMMTSIRPLELVLREIVGPNVSVLSLISPLQSPHTYDPTPKDLMNLEKSTVFFYVSPTLDAWVVRSQLESPKTIETLAWVKNKVEISHDHHDHGHHHDDFDPHFWMNPLTVNEILGSLVEKLCEVFKDHCDEFKLNSNKFSTKLSQLDQEIAAELKPFKNEALLSAHPFLGYFARQYKLRQLGAVETVPGKTPTAKDIISLTKLVKKEDIKALFSEPQISIRSIEVLAEGTGLKIVQLDPQGADPKIKTYRDLIWWNTQKIKEAFQK